MPGRPGPAAPEPIGSFGMPTGPGGDSAEDEDSVAYHKSSAMNGELTKIEDIVPWVRHLLTDGWWANGQTLFVNGGYTTR